MKSLIKARVWYKYIILALVLIVAGCDDKNGVTTPVDEPTVLDLIQLNANLSTFESLIEGTAWRQPYPVQPV